jgi:hypothetical protein
MRAITPTFSTRPQEVSRRLAWSGSGTLAACHISEGLDRAYLAPEPQSHGRLRRRMNWTSDVSGVGAGPHRPTGLAFGRLGPVSEPVGRTRPGPFFREAERERGQLGALTSCAMRRLSRRR